MTFRGVTLCLALAVTAVACSDDGDPAATTTSPSTAEITTTTTAPEREPSTTTTAFDPATVEGEVEAAYLRSWDVYAEAVYDLVLDEAALAEVYAETTLENLIQEIRDRAAEGRAALVRVEHNYEVSVVDASTALVVDAYRNHQVLIDPETKEPIEPDPNDELLYSFTLRLIDGAWRVAKIERVSP